MATEELSIDDPPTSIDPYTVLEVTTSATASEVKVAYRRLALRRHPDKAPPGEREVAHQAFQELAFAYAILGDERRRRRYDTTGSTAETLEDDDDDFDWLSFFRAQSTELLTRNRLEEFSREYKNSAEERADVLKVFAQVEGNLNKLYEQVMLSNPLDDETRFVSIIDEAIEASEARPYAKYTEETAKAKQKRMDRARKEATEAAKELERIEAEKSSSQDSPANGKHATKAKGKGKQAPGDMSDLAALIQQRQTSRSASFFDHLEAKYAGKGKSGSKRKATDEPSEAAFEATRRRLEENRNKSKTSGKGKRAKGKA